MSGFIPKILIFGHSFVRRLNDDLYSSFDKRARINFHMASSGDVSLKGIGGSTVDKVFAHDIEWLKGSKPDILILELGTNYLSCLPPEVVGSWIHDLACFMRDEVRVSIVGVSGRRSQYTWFVKPGHGVSCQSRQVAAVFVCGVGG